MMKWIKRKIGDQWLDISQTVYKQTWSDRDKSFFIDSPLGLLQYRPKNEKDLARFRDKWLNEFDRLIGFPEPTRTVEVAKFYSRIRSGEKIKYRANVRTRLKAKRYAI